MSMNQQGDVDLFHTRDDGEIIVDNGIVQMSGGIGTAAYLSIFGGNEDDPGDSDTSRSWWGNSIETEPERRYRSRTQYLLSRVPLTPSALRRIEEAATRDLQWMLDERLVNSLKIEATIPALNTVKIHATITAEGDPSNFRFVENWPVGGIELDGLNAPTSVVDVLFVLELADESGLIVLFDGSGIEVQVG